jgi:hypothetical protein
MIGLKFREENLLVIPESVQNTSSKLRNIIAMSLKRTLLDTCF